jgi:tRNA(Ile)-lysidine synthase
VSLVRKAQETLRRECPVEKGAGVIVACSAGADSTALLHFLFSERKRLEIGRLGVYHLNHRLRGEEADADERFVAELARSFDIPFHPERADVAAYASEHGLSLEMAGRRLRYKGLQKLIDLESRGGRVCYGALGHTASDNAEWLLLSLIRGRAEPLLWGIPAKRGPFIRPLIRCTRTEIGEYLRKHHLSFREDSSNLSFSFDRNLIRHRIIPLLKELNPSLEETLTRSIEIGDTLKSSLDHEAAQILESLSSRGGCELDTLKLSSYNPVTQLRVLRLFAPWLGANDILRLMPLGTARGTREISRGPGKRLALSYNRLVIEAIEDQPVWKPMVLREGEDVLVPGLGWLLRVNKDRVGDLTHRETLAFGEDVAYFDADLVKPPFVVRPWCEGDRIVPFARHSAVKLKRVFITRKVPRAMRRYWPLVCKGDEVLWVAGLMRSAAARITKSTRKLTILTCLRGEDGK